MPITALYARVNASLKISLQQLRYIRDVELRGRLRVVCAWFARIQLSHHSSIRRPISRHPAGNFLFLVRKGGNESLLCADPGVIAMQNRPCGLSIPDQHLMVRR
jgi:hypothetical protein